MELLTLLNSALCRVHARARAKCCSPELPNVIRAIARELGLTLAEPTLIVTTSAEMCTELARVIETVEAAHLSPETRARVAEHLDQLRSVATAHERMVGGLGHEGQATP